MQKIIFLLIFNIALEGTVSAQDYALTAGLKLGYTWGNGGGSFNTGGEISLIYLDRANYNYFCGLVLDYEPISHLKSSKIHLGFEYSFRFIGADIGPSFLFGEKNKFGITMIPYAGFILIPYGDFTFYDEFSTQSAGAYLKIPLWTDMRIRFGG